MNPIEQDECFRTPFKVAEALVAAAEDITRGQVGTNGRDLQLFEGRSLSIVVVGRCSVLPNGVARPMSLWVWVQIRVKVRVARLRLGLVKLFKTNLGEGKGQG